MSLEVRMSKLKEYFLFLWVLLFSEETEKALDCMHNGPND